MKSVGLVVEETLHLMGDNVLLYFQERMVGVIQRASLKFNVFCTFQEMGLQWYCNQLAKEKFPNRIFFQQVYYEHPLATLSIHSPHPTEQNKLFGEFCDFLIVVRSHSQSPHSKIDYMLGLNKPTLLVEFYKDDQWLNLE